MRATVNVMLVLAVSAAGCAAQPSSSRPSSSVNLSGYSAAFRQGYNDGCDSARSTLRRNERRYQEGGDYRMGWNDGHSVCLRQR